ncbi:MAG: CBS domain-containing protein [Kordiimonadaceae bacterium]|nr:CBS domain-containing protein [Kordiimonadaceae bacterium]MBT6033174.1 CBS domain-containing protein [Kordiimonadaceae bacterium]
MYVKNILLRKGNEVISISPESTMLETAKVLRENKIGAVLACDTGGKMCGVISERDLVIAIAKCGGEVLEKKVGDFMTTGVYTCKAEDSIKKVMEVMTSRRIRHLPVVDDEGNITGMISIGDVVKERMSETEAEAEALKAYIAT